MDLTPAERKFVRPYLRANARAGKGWIVGVLLGLGVIAAAILFRLSDSGPEIGPYFLMAVVVGMVIIEMSIDHRSKMKMARILQKYEAAVREAQEPE